MKVPVAQVQKMKKSLKRKKSKEKKTRSQPQRNQRKRNQNIVQGKKLLQAKVNM